MKEEQYYLALDHQEHGIMLRALNELKSDLRRENRSTDAVDDLIIKTGYAPKKKFRVIEKRLDEVGAR